MSRVLSLRWRSSGAGFAAAIVLLGMLALVVPSAHSGGSEAAPPKISTVDFIWSPLTPTVGELVHFYNTSSSSGGGWSWSFGDGGTSTETDPTHTYTAAGDFTVVLSLEGGMFPLRSSETLTVIPPGTPPSASFSWSPTNPTEGQAVVFTDTSSGGPTSRTWDFGDGSTATTAQVEHVFASAGTYQVELTVTNPSGSDSVTQTVTVLEESSAPPVTSPGEQVYVIPASAHAAGQSGTSWVTDMVMLNTGFDPVTANLYFLEGGHSNLDAYGRQMIVPGGSSLRIDDIVLGTFGESSSSGALLLGTQLSMVVSSRTYNDATSGTYGQYIPGLNSSAAFAVGETALLVQLTSNDRFRTNIGFANAAADSVDVEVVLVRADGSALASRSLTLPPYGYHQAGDLFSSAADDAYALVSSPTSGASYFTYASVVDNLSGDPVFVLPAEVVSGGDVFVPASAHATGVGGTVWRTDLEVVNVGADAAAYSLAFMPSGQDNSEPDFHPFSLASGAARRHGDLVSTVFGQASAAGAVRVRVTTGQILVTSRTYNDADGGTYGQFIAGMPDTMAFATGQHAYLPQLSSSSAYRSNLGFLSTEDVSCTIEVEVRHGDGDLIGTTSIDLPPFGWTQVTDLVGQLASGDVDNAWARVWTMTSGAHFLAYASVVDNLSGDPVFIPATALGGVSPRLTFSATWDDPGVDLDLHVVEPDGTEIYWDNPQSESGGTLTRDCNCGSPCGVENIGWEAGLAMEGVYSFWVSYWDWCDAPTSLDVELQVARGDEIVQTHTATLSGPDETTPEFLYTHILGSEEDPNSCVGYCGDQAPGGCWCDPECLEYGDCCFDFVEVCGGGEIDPDSCEDHCGDQAPGGCWCDDLCEENFDCCDDYYEFCVEGGDCEPTPIDFGQAQGGAWSSACMSTHRPGSYAAFRTFSLATAADVLVDLYSFEADPYLYLLSGSGSQGSVVTSDDDGLWGLDSRIEAGLDPGTYTIEATTFDSQESGTFTLALLEGACVPQPISLGQTVAGSWTGACSSIHNSGCYAVYYLLVVDAAVDVVIDLESNDVDTYLWVLEGASPGSPGLDYNDDGGTGYNSRLELSLQAGVYTIEATTFSYEATGPFTLTISGSR